MWPQSKNGGVHGQNGVKKTKNFVLLDQVFEN
jgi:hypothetical protein